MYKTQRARYLALLATLATHTPAETAEFTPLAELAAKHPDASKDTDAPAAPPTAPPSPAASAPAAAPTLRGFIASLKTGAAAGTELVTLRAQLATLTTANAGLTTELTAARADTTAARAERDTLCAYLGLTAAEVSGKKPADITALITAKISDQSIELVAGLGVPMGNLPAAKGENSGDTLADVQAQMATEKDPVKLGQLAAQANKLRDAAWGIKPGKN